MKYAELPIAEVHANPNQPRKHFEQAALQELADSIKANGQIQPSVVRPVDGGYMIIAGERRWRAQQLAGNATIPCMIIDGLDDEQAFILSTLENVARRDMRPIEEAKAYAAIVAMGKTPAEVGELVGKAPFAVAWRLELLNLAPELQDVELPMNVARLMSRMSIDGQRAAIARSNRGEFKTAQEWEKYCNAVIAREAQTDLFAADQLDAFGSDDLRRERAAITRSRFQTRWEKVMGLGALMVEFDEMSEQDLADALDGDLDLRLAELRTVEAAIRRQRIKLENAKALQKIA